MISTEIKVLKQHMVLPGVHEVIIDGEYLTSGSYKAVIHSDGEILSKSAIIK